MFFFFVISGQRPADIQHLSPSLLVERTWARLCEERGATSSKGSHHREPILHHCYGLPHGLPVHRGYAQWHADPCCCEYNLANAHCDLHCQTRAETYMCELVTGTYRITYLSPAAASLTARFMCGKCGHDRKEGDVFVSLQALFQYTSTAGCYFVYSSHPSFNPVSEWKIDLLFCLAEAQTCQLLTGY